MKPIHMVYLAWDLQSAMRVKLHERRQAETTRTEKRCVRGKRLVSNDNLLSCAMVSVERKVVRPLSLAKSANEASH